MSAPSAAPRITSIDAYRGLVMFLLLAEVLHLPALAKNHPDDPVWKAIGFHTSHVEWTGAALHDMIQPSFSFLVGVAVPFSIASRLSKGQSFLRMFGHAVWRAFLLVALGVFLRSNGRPMTNFTFEDTLSQIGLGYVFLFLLGFRSIAWQWGAFVAILIGYWLAFFLHPLPSESFDYASVGVPASWAYHETGLLAHWNKNSNLAWEADRWLLNLFPRTEPFSHNGGGYATLSFVPTLGTMILGLIAGNWMKNVQARGKVLFWLFLAGAVCLGAGVGAEAVGVNPIVKRIWTPAWTLFSGGICFLILFGFSVLFDGRSPIRFLAFPLLVLGANSIFVYCTYELLVPWVEASLNRHLELLKYSKWYDQMPTLTQDVHTLVRGGLVMLVFWLAALWLYVKRIFIRI